MTTTKNTQTFDAIFQEMKVHGMKLPSDKVYLNVPDSRRLLFSAIRYFVSLEKKEAVWLPEYEKVASWLNDNGGRGLFLYGTCGRGKSILAGMLCLLSYSNMPAGLSLCLISRI